VVHPVGTTVSAAPRKPRRRALGLGLSVATLALLAAACGGSSGSAPGAGAAASASGSSASPATHSLKSVQVALALDPPKMVFIGFYVASDEGFFARNGLRVTLEPELSGVQAAQAVAAGDAVFSAGGTDAVAASAAENGGQIAIWSYAKDDLSIVSDSSITSVSQLRGKNIGLGDATGPAYQLSVLALEQAHVPLSAVRFDILNGRPALVSALIAGRIQATVFHVDDGLTALQKDSKIHILRAMYDSAPDYWYGALSVPTKYAKQNPGTVKAFLTAMVEADRWMYSHKAQTVQIGIKYTNESPTVVSQAYDFLTSHHLWTENAGATAQEVAYTLNLYKKSKTISTVPPVSKVMDFSYIDSVLSQLGRVSG
jgi:NitT/TauT family transport system substrate-binding protein